MNANKPLFDLELLRAVVTVVDCGSFTAAAARLHSTQSTISQKVRRLEDMVGYRLLERDRRQILPTDAGQTLLGHARHLLSMNDQLLDALAGASVSQTIRLGVPEDFIADQTTRVLADFSRQHPRIKLEITSGLCADLSDGFDHGELDLMLVKQRRDSRAAMACQPEFLVWIDSAHHPSFQNDPTPLVVFPPRGLYRDEIIHALEAMGRRWRICFTCSSLNGIQNAVAAGLGISLLPQRAVTAGHVVLDAAQGLPTIDQYEIGIFHRSSADAMVQALARALADMLAREVRVSVRHPASGAHDD